MALPLSLLAVQEASENLLQCVCEGLARIPLEIPTLAGCPCRTCVVPGAVAADGCGSGCGTLAEGEYPGQLTVSVIRTYATDFQAFPREQALRGVATIYSKKECVPPPTTAVEMAITLFRCAPVQTGACPPTCEELNAAATQLHVDLLAVQNSVICCYADTDTVNRNGRRFVMGPSRVVGPQGDCVGLEQRITVALDGCLPCPPAAPEPGVLSLVDLLK